MNMMEDMSTAMRTTMISLVNIIIRAKESLKKRLNIMSNNTIDVIVITKEGIDDKIVGQESSIKRSKTQQSIKLMREEPW